MSSHAAAPSIARRLANPPKLLILLVLLVGFFLRVYRLANRSVWWDEGYTGWLARQPLGEIATITAHDVHPPLYYWLLSGWRLLSGDSEFGLRFFSVIVGLLTVAVVYRLGRTDGGRWVALLAAFLLAVSRFHISWSQEIRMYVLAALWAALALWATIQYWKRPSIRYGLLYILFMAAGLYTLYLFALVFVIANIAALWWLWRGARRLRMLAYWTALQVGVLLLYLPWILYALGRIRVASTASPLNFPDFLKIYWTMLTMGIPVAVEQYARFTLPLLILALLSLLVLARRAWGEAIRESIFLLLALAVTFPALAVYLISLPRDAFFYAPQIAPRYLIILMPAYVVLLAFGLWALTSRWRLLTLLAVLAVVVVGLLGLRSYHPGRVAHDDYQSLAAAVDAYRQPDDAVILLTDRDWPLFAFYYPGDWAGVPDSWQLTPEVAADFLEQRWLGHDGIWLVNTPYAALVDPQESLASWLQAHAAGTATYDFGDKQLAFYARDDQRAATIGQVADSSRAQAIDVRSPAGPELYGYDLPVREYESGDMMVLSLFWRGQGQETVTAGFMDREGQVFQSKTMTVTVAGEPERQQLNMVVPPEAPSGDYQLFVQFPAGPAVSIGDFALRQRQRAVLGIEDVQIDLPTDYTFANGVRLLGYDIAEREVRPGESVSLTLYWQTEQPLEERYKVFTHVQGTAFNNEGNQLWGQQDNEPVNGRRPLPLWHVGEVIVDDYSIPINALAPPGEYALNVGLYHPVSGERLPVTGAGETADHVALTTLTVSLPE